MADHELAKFHTSSETKDDQVRELRQQRLTDFVILLVLVVPLMFAAMALLEALQRSQCPSSTFLSGTLRPGVDMVAILTAVLGTTYLVRLWLMDRWTWLRERLRQNDPDKKTPRWAYSIAAAAIAVGVPLSAWAALCQFCATPPNLSFRPEPWATMRSYDWDRVAAVATTCSSGRRGSWNTNYLVVMTDGTVVNLMDSPKNFASGYSGVARALHGRSFVFDSRRVHANCGSPYRHLLVNRP